MLKADISIEEVGARKGQKELRQTGNHPDLFVGSVASARPECRLSITQWLSFLFFIFF